MKRIDFPSFRSDKRPRCSRHGASEARVTRNGAGNVGSGRDARVFRRTGPHVHLFPLLCLAAYGRTLALNCVGDVWVDVWVSVRRLSHCFSVLRNLADADWASRNRHKKRGLGVILSLVLW